MMRLATAARLALLAAAALAPLAGGGCYYLHVGVGQAKVLLGREPIEEALASKDLSVDERAKLALVPDVRTFAHERLGLVKNGSYTSFYDTGKRPVSWNVCACAKTAFAPYTWHFPFVGAAPYKGFFDEDEAKSEAADLRAQGYDVQVYEVGAYSTLGWFDDPVFRRMLSDDSYELSNTIIHELTHATCFRSGDVEFNESLATFVGNEGALAFLAARFGPGSDELRAARDAIADEATFAAFVEGLYAKLDAVYRGPAPDVEKLAARERVFAQAKLDFEAVRAARMREPQLWGWFARKKLDNTTILSFRRYHMDLDAYADVLALCGGDFPTALAIYREAAASDDPRATLRTWSLFAAQVKVRDGAPKAAQEPLKKGVVPAAAVSPNKS